MATVGPYARSCRWGSERMNRMYSSAVLPQIAIPTLFITGSENSGFTPEQATEPIRLVPGGRLEVVDHAAYLPPLEQPEATAQLVVDFWQRSGRPVSDSTPRDNR